MQRQGLQALVLVFKVADARFEFILRGRHACQRFVAALEAVAAVVQL